MSQQASSSKSVLPANSWLHFVAGGVSVCSALHFILLTDVSVLGGMCGAIVTSPFDVVKTRLQSDLFRVSATASVGSGGVLVASAPKPGGATLELCRDGTHPCGTSTAPNRPKPCSKASGRPS